MNRYKKIILNNGIPLYLCVDPTMKKVFVSYNLKYGSSGEWFNYNYNGKDYHVIAGHAHYLEHLLGEHSQFGNIYKEFGRRFQTANAFTGMNETSFLFFGKDDIEKSIEELIIAIETPVFEQKDVDETRHAIEEEAATYIDNNEKILNGLNQRNLYNGFELIDKTLSRIGNRETTKQITIDGLYNCYNAFYSDNNKYIVIGGNVDEQRIVDLLNNIYSKITPHKSNLVLPELDYDSIRRKSEIINGDLDTPKVGLGMKFKKDDSVLLKELYYALYLIRNSFLESKELRDSGKKGLYDIIDFSYMTIVNDYINYSFGFSSKYKDTLINNVLELLSKRTISKEEYELAQKGLIAARLRSMENKYKHLMVFPNRVHYTEDYSECEFYQSVDYNRFMEIVSSLDFSNWTVNEVKRLKK